MAREYQSYAGVDRVTGAVGPLFYAVLKLETSWWRPERKDSMKLCVSGRIVFGR